MKLKEISNHFYINKNILNVSKLNKNYKFRTYFRYFLKNNLYTLVKKKILTLLKFNNNCIREDKIKFNFNINYKINNNIINSRTFNYIYILKKKIILIKKKIISIKLKKFL